MPYKLTFTMLKKIPQEISELFNLQEEDKYIYQMINHLNVLDIIISPLMPELTPMLMI